MTSKALRIIVPIAVSVITLSSMILVAYLLDNGDLPTLVISKHDIINFTFTMQMAGLILSFIALAFVYYYRKDHFILFFRLGSKSPVNWLSNGIVIAVLFTAGTAFFLSSKVMAEHGTIDHNFWQMLPLVILFAGTNAWSEEIFSRFVIVAGLYEKLNPSVICWISGIIFGLAHFRGTPNGISGIMLSGLLGGILAKSMIETKGIRWALLIHFLQDLVIFGAGAMILASQKM